MKRVKRGACEQSNSFHPGRCGQDRKSQQCFHRLGVYAILRVFGGCADEVHPRLVVQRPISVEVSSCDYSQDGRIALTGNIEGKVRLMDVATGAQLQSFWVAGRILHATLSPDNRKVLTISVGSVVQLWDADTGKQMGRFVPKTGSLIYGAVFPDGSTVATATWVETEEHGDKLPPPGAMMVQMWDVETGKELQHYLVPGAVRS